MEDQVQEQTTTTNLADEYLAGWKRATADYANLKKEVEKNREETAKYAGASAINALLPVADYFNKAMAERPPTHDLDERTTQWINGVEHIKKQFDTVLKNSGVTVINTANVPFDPMFHEAMMSEKNESAAGTVLKILEPGYTLHDKVLRPAKVVVAE